MIAFLKGKFVHKSPDHVVTECNGVGYHVRISLNTYSKLQGSNEGLLHTHLAIKEDAHELYGFAETAEKELFLQLISISGVGGNTALLILSSVQPADLHSAIEKEDVETLRRIKGIGPKTAGRIILELKGKLKLSGSESGKSGGSPLRQEALSALTGLGFPRPEMEKRVDAILAKDNSLKLEEVIRQALKG